MDVSEVAAQPVQSAQSAQPAPHASSTSPPPGYIPLKMYEDLLKENEELKKQLQTSVPLKLYEDLMIENSKLKKRQRATETERNKLKYRNKNVEHQLKVRKTGKDLSKKAKHEITREVLAPKLSEAELDCYLNDQKKSTKWNNQGRILHMLKILYRSPKVFNSIQFFNFVQFLILFHF